jgi:hypothetical protein
MLQTCLPPCAAALAVGKRHRRARRFLFPGPLLAAFALAAGLGAPLQAKDALDYRQMRNEIQIFENILQTAIKNEFNHPLALVNDPRGTYLPGYGISFSFLLNINRDEVDTPFGVKRFNGQGRTRAEKLRIIRDIVFKVLSDFGGSLTQIGLDENLAVAAHLEDRTALVATQRDEVMLFRVGRKTLADYSSRRIDQKQFRDRVEIIEY